MAEAFLRSFDSQISVDSAGTEPAERVHPLVLTVMREIGFDLSKQRPKNANAFIDQSFDYVITVCDHANETCPVFLGSVKHRLHFGFDDPAKAIGSEEQVLAEFRRIRDEIRNRFYHFYRTDISGNIRKRRKSKMQVKVLGTGCAKCRALEERVRKVAEQNQIAIELEKVTQIDDLLSYGIMMTPGLVIDGQVKSAGNLPLEKDILAWLKG